MTFLRLTSIAVRRFGRSVLRLSNCRQMILATAILASPCAGFFEGQEVESPESSTPVEERGDGSELLATAGAAPTRRSLERTTSAFGLKRDTDGSTRLHASHLRLGRFVSGHRLANGLYAPLRC